jgi:monofunctional biosynthetic peptidoglycan transglycosylase
MADPIAEVPPAAPAAVEVERAPARTRSRLALNRWVQIAAVLAVAWLAWEAITWPDVAGLARRNPASTAFIDEYRGHGWLAPKKAVDWRWVSYGRIAASFKHAALIGEDDEFFSHHGFARDEMEDALREAWQEKHLPRGASTITQQLAKNLWLSRSRNPLRKVKEALLTRQLERDLPKRRILEIYLNVVELGPGIYGVESGARHYFHQSAASLTNHQAAALAASLPYPEKWHPGSRSRSYLWRVRLIERRMARSLWLRSEL